MKKSLLIAFLIIFLIIPIVSIAQVQTGSFIFEGLTRYYLVYLPQNYNGVDPMPVVFNLHGYTLNMTQQMNYSRMNAVADSEGFIAVYPNAAGAGWNAGINGFFSNINDVGFFNVLIDTLAEHYSIDLDRIYSCGFSLGGFMSNRLACELSNRIAAIATVAGLMGDSVANTCNPGHPMPVLLIHGTYDGLVPYNGAYDWLSVQELINHWNSYNLCTESDTTSLPDLDPLDGCTVQRINYTHCLDSAGITLFKVIQGGHTWPGGDTSWLHLSWGEIGKTNFDINASQEIWNFFNNDYVIPVELTSFTATTNGKEIILNWSTATEINNSGFEIERRIISGGISGNWNKIGFTPGFGTTTEPKEYSYVDNISGINANAFGYRLKQVDFDGSFEYSDEVFVDKLAPVEFVLEQNYPNPFNPTTTIGFGLQNKSNVRITILNAIGEEVADVLNEEREPGFYEVEFNAANLPSGVYLYQLKAGEYVNTKKMILVK